jgi:hypothetical protein
MTQDGLTEAAACLVASSGAGRGPVTLTPLPGGANNRVFAVEGADRPALLKSYFRGPGDRRDRLGAEFGFSRFAWNAGLRTLPEPLASDDEAGLGLYALIEGAPIDAAAVDSEAVAAAAAFVAGLVSVQHRPDAERLLHASEACFTLEEHLARVDTRVAQVAALEPADDLDLACASFVEGTLAPRWARLRERTRAAARSAGVALDVPLPAAERCLSPSDFGFHNALRAPDGTFRFLDFEYAGWDDPAKLVADFFCQVAVPVPLVQLQPFVDAALARLPGRTAREARIAFLLDVYRVKWCCILLNDFVPAGRDRRRFALGQDDFGERRAAKLRLATEALLTVQPNSE